MLREIRRSGDALAPDELSVLETEIGAAVPDPYRSFLLRYNGGAPSPNVVDVGGAPGTPTDVQVFFGVRRSIETSNIGWNKRMFAERIPSPLLPIAVDSGGNLFCLTLSGPRRGNIMYATLEGASPQFYLVATDFDLFLAKLRDWES
jgi:hypothetical protein